MLLEIPNNTSSENASVVEKFFRFTRIRFSLYIFKMFCSIVKAVSKIVFIKKRSHILIQNFFVLRDLVEIFSVYHHVLLFLFYKKFLR